MTYSPLIPQGPPSPKDQTDDVRTNFSQFGSIFDTNHTAFNTPHEGDHDAIIFQKQSVDPEVTQNLSTLYGKDATSFLSTEPQLFTRILKFLPTGADPTDGDNTPMQLTYNAVNTAGPMYQSFLVGAYLVYFGSTNNIAANIVLSPTPTQILIALAIPNNMAGGGLNPFDVSTEIISSTTFKINSDLATGVYTFKWMAIATA